MPSDSDRHLLVSEQVRVSVELILGYWPAAGHLICAFLSLLTIYRTAASYHDSAERRHSCGTMIFSRLEWKIWDGCDLLEMCVDVLNLQRKHYFLLTMARFVGNFSVSTPVEYDMEKNETPSAAQLLWLGYETIARFCNGGTMRFFK